MRYFLILFFLIIPSVALGEHRILLAWDYEGAEGADFVVQHAESITGQRLELRTKAKQIEIPIPETPVRCFWVGASQGPQAVVESAPLCVTIKKKIAVPTITFVNQL